MFTRGTTIIRMYVCMLLAVGELPNPPFSHAYLPHGGSIKLLADDFGRAIVSSAAGWTSRLEIDQRNTYGSTYLCNETSS